MSLPEEGYWAALNNLSKLGNKKILKIIQVFGSAKGAWEAPEEEVRRKLFPAELAEQFILLRAQLNAEEYYEKILQNNIKVLTMFDSDYPQNLKHISGAPPVLYIRGAVPCSSLLHIAIVGTRKATIYGKQVTRKLSYDLASRGAVIVSGMARGIDSCAHMGAIEAGGKTIAVLGCGVDVVYPRENKRLIDQICEVGAVISEFPLGMPPNKQNFPARNRIISGLCSGVLVIEAPERSGALITANFALEQGRDVFAVPGPINSKFCRGSNRLLKEGAKLVETAEDVLEEYRWNHIYYPLEEKNEDKNTSCTAGINQDMKEILDLLSSGPAFLDELCALTGKTAGQLNILLTQMELKGLITRAEGKIHMII